jgi:ABC-2 type transport system ATP-binding protein
MAVLHGGRLRFAGTPAELKGRYSTAVLEEAFLECISQNS